MIQLNDTQKGLMLVVGGLILLLYALGIFTAFLNVIMIVLCTTMIVWGAIKLHWYKKILELIHRKK